VGTGAKVEIPLHHTIVSGMTGTGKTTLLKRIIAQLYKGIIFDVKEDYSDILTVPPKVTADITDSLAIKEILEVYGGMGLKGEFPELIKATTSAKDLWDVLENIKKMLERDNIHPVRKDKLLIIHELLQNFIRDIGPLLALGRSRNDRIMRIDISPLSLPLQQYIVKEELRALENDTVVIIDEAHRFVPERESSISKREIINLLREGRSRNNFVILSDQTITGISKEALKQCWNWVMGRQLEINEVKRVLNQTMSIRKDAKDIASLRVGEFIYFTPNETIRFYSWPPFMSKEDAIIKAISMGEGIFNEKNEKKNIEDKWSMEKEMIISILRNLITVIEGLIEKINSIDMEKDLASSRPRELILNMIKKKPGISEMTLRKVVARKIGLSETNIVEIIRELIDQNVIVLKKKGDEIIFYPNSIDAGRYVIG